MPREFSIINKRTGKVVGNANTIGGARNSVDRNDNKYGAYVHIIKDSAGNTRMAKGRRSTAKTPKKGK